MDVSAVKSNLEILKRPQYSTAIDLTSTLCSTATEVALKKATLATLAAHIKSLNADSWQLDQSKKKDPYRLVAVSSPHQHLAWNDWQCSTILIPAELHQLKKIVKSYGLSPIRLNVSIVLSTNKLLQQKLRSKRSSQTSRNNRSENLH